MNNESSLSKWACDFTLLISSLAPRIGGMPVKLPGLRSVHKKYEVVEYNAHPANLEIAQVVAAVIIILYSLYRSISPRASATAALSWTGLIVATARSDNLLSVCNRVLSTLAARSGGD